MTRMRFLADSMPQALDAARRELGADMRVLHATTRRGALWPFAGSVEAEVVAEVALGALHRRSQRSRSSRLPDVRLRLAARLALAQAIAAAHGAATSAASEAGDALAEAQSAFVHGTPQVVPALVTRLVARLRAQGLSGAIADQVSARVLREIGAELRPAEHEVRQSFVNAVAAFLPVAEHAEIAPARAEGRPHVVAMVGPTGVGKTTTVAKLAADCRVRLGLRVGIVAADAYRVGAVDQLQAYAQILGAPMRAADSPSAVRSAMLDLAWCDVVLIDTAGRSHRDAARIAEVALLLGAARPDDTHLVLSAAGSPRALSEAAAAFRHARPTRVVLSKLDECETPGALVHALLDAHCPASWFTTGQDVPDDIERATAHGLAERIVDAAAVTEVSA